MTQQEYIERQAIIASEQLAIKQKIVDFNKRLSELDRKQVELEQEYLSSVTEVKTGEPTVFKMYCNGKYVCDQTFIVDRIASVKDFETKEIMYYVMEGRKVSEHGHVGQYPMKLLYIVRDFERLKNMEYTVYTR